MGRSMSIVHGTTTFCLVAELIQSTIKYQSQFRAYGKPVRPFFIKTEENMKQLEKEIIAVNKKESTERLRSYKKAVADILTEVKMNKNKEGENK